MAAEFQLDLSRWWNSIMKLLIAGRRNDKEMRIPAAMMEARILSAFDAIRYVEHRRPCEIDEQMSYFYIRSHENRYSRFDIERDYF